MRAFISQAVRVFREFPNDSDEDILRKLITAGIERPTATRLVEFLPMAYCRVILADSGLKFCDSFQRKLADGTVSSERPLEKEPVWNETLLFAQAEKQTGVTGKALLAVAAHGSEFAAANQLANRGSKLADIVLMPTILPWPEDGPHSAT